MDVRECLRTRRSIRAYQDKPVPKEIIAEVIDCARMSPSAINIQPWEFVVVTAPETRKKIADLTDYGKFIANAPVCVAVFCKDTKYYLEDGSAATMAILLAAWSHGLGTCWVAGDKKHYAEPIRQLLGVLEGYKLVSLIAMGYPAENPTKEKRPLSEVLHWERFGQHEI
jgi:nitroreductase